MLAVWSQSSNSTPTWESYLFMDLVVMLNNTQTQICKLFVFFSIIMYEATLISFLELITHNLIVSTEYE